MSNQRNFTKMSMKVEIMLTNQLRFIEKLPTAHSAGEGVMWCYPQAMGQDKS